MNIAPRAIMLLALIPCVTGIAVAARQAGTAENPPMADAVFPLGALGGIARVYVVPNVSITGEVSGFKVSSLGDVHNGHWTDVDIYGTANFTRNVGAQIGFRSVDLGYQIKADSGSLTLKGVYFGIVARYLLPDTLVPAPLSSRGGELQNLRFFLRKEDA